MKKLLFLLAVAGIIFTACQSGSDIEEDNGGIPFVPEITISPDELSFPVEGGKQEVAITANFEYEVSEKADWLSVEQTETGLLVKVDKSECVEKRYADIVLTNKEYKVEKFISVSQAAFEPSITIKPSVITFSANGGEQEVAITANFEYEYSTNADWLTITKSEKGITVTVPNYVEVDERTAKITISSEKYGVSKVVDVAQKAFVPEWTIEPESLTFAIEGGTQEIAITANFEYEVSEKADWLSVEQTETGLLVTAKESKNTSERTTYISIINEKYSITKTIDIVQEAWVPKIELAQQSIEVEFEPAEYEVAVTSPFSWEATTKNDWIVIESKTGIAGEEVLRFSTKRNEDEEKERKGTITLRNTDYNLVAELYITQKTFVPDEIIVEPKSLTFDYKGGTKEVSVTANFEYEYSTNVDWLTFEKRE